MQVSDVHLRRGADAKGEINHFRQFVDDTLSYIQPAAVLVTGYSLFITYSTVRYLISEVIHCVQYFTLHFCILYYLMVFLITFFCNLPFLLSGIVLIYNRIQIHGSGHTLKGSASS